MFSEPMMAKYTDAYYMRHSASIPLALPLQSHRGR